MIKNKKKYKYDEAWLAKNPIIVSKREVEKLLEDQDKDLLPSRGSGNSSRRKNLPD
jgi:hypothetical protein